MRIFSKRGFKQCGRTDPDAGGRWSFSRGAKKQSWRGIHSEGGKKERREKQKVTGR